LSLDVGLLECFCDRCERGDNVFAANVTHNLGEMAAKADLYQALWRPEEIGATLARHITPLLKRGLAKLEAQPDEMRRLNPPNGFGTYEYLVFFTRKYLAACEAHPEAHIKVSR